MVLNILWLFCIGFLIAQTASLVTTIYLHRSSTHKAVEYTPAVEFLMQLWLWLTTGINRKEWVAVHLYHHSYADIEGKEFEVAAGGSWVIEFHIIRANVIGQNGLFDGVAIIAGHIKNSMEIIDGRSQSVYLLSLQSRTFKGEKSFTQLSWRKVGKWIIGLFETFGNVWNHCWRLLVELFFRTCCCSLLA